MKGREHIEEAWVLFKKSWLCSMCK
jgi:hypothetical protein